MTLVLVLYVNSVNASEVNTKQSIFNKNYKNILTTNLLTRAHNLHKTTSLQYWWWYISITKYIYWKGSFQRGKPILKKSCYFFSYGFTSLHNTSSDFIMYGWTLYFSSQGNLQFRKLSILDNSTFFCPFFSSFLHLISFHVWNFLWESPFFSRYHSYHTHTN